MGKAFWKQNGVMITLMTTLWLGLAGLMMTSHSGIRADMREMRADHALIRSEIGTVRGEMRAELGVFRSEMGAEFRNVRSEMREGFRNVRSEMGAELGAFRSEMGEELGGIRARLDGLDTRFGSLDRRTARIEGHLFGVELPDDASEPVFDDE